MIIYIISKIVLVLSFLYTGYFIFRNKIKTNYWYSVLPLIVTYSLIEGLRYNRGVDYKHYKNLYDYSLNIQSYWDVNKIEVFFQLINKTFKYIDTPYYLVFVFYSFILVFSGCFFLTTRKYISMFFLPFFLLATLNQSENLVRQYMAFSFFLFSLTFLFKNKYLFSLLFFLFATLTHTSSLFLLPFILFFFLIDRVFINIKLIYIIYTIPWLWNQDYWSGFYSIFGLFEKINIYSDYSKDAELWFSGQKLLNNHSLFYYTRLFIFNILLLHLGYKITKTYRDKILTFVFNFFIVGALTQKYFIRIELLYRVNLYFYVFWFYILSFICFDTFIKKSYKKNNIEYICVFYLLINVIFDYFISTLVPNTNKETLFVWDV